MQINTKSITADNSRRRLWQRVVSTLVCVVVFCTTYALIMPAITISEPVYCNLDEHTHTDECYADGELVCARLEHMHNLSCYSDPNADLETEDDWLADVLNANVLGDSLADVAYVAVSQLGYAESTNNYIVHEDGASVSGYTRFGAWSGDPYAPWNIAFVNFCVYYAGYDYLEGYQPVDDLIEWATVLSQNGILYTPYALPELGQLAIVNEEGTLYLGIVSGRGDNGEVRVIVGDYNGKVAKLEFMPDETNLIGYVGLENILNVEASLDFADEPVSDGLTASVTVNGDDVNADSNADTIINDDSDPIDNDGESADDSENPNDSDEESEDNDATPNGTNDVEEENPSESAPADDEVPTDDENNSEVNPDNGETPEENTDNNEPSDEATPVDPDAEESNDDETPIDGQYNSDNDTPATADETEDGDSTGGQETETSTPIDMAEHITSISLTHKGQGTNWEWKNISDGTVYDYDSFKVNISYVLQVGTLVDGNDTIYYQLPEQIKLFNKKDGDVYDSKGDIVGKYEITTDGLITIKFFDEYVKKNGNLADDTSGIIDGYISAEIYFNDSAWDENGKIDIKFEDGSQDGLEIEIKKEKTYYNDLTVEKTQGDLNPETGEVEYKIVVKSENGTGTDVNLSDNMTNLTYVSGLTVVDKEGKQVEYTGTANEGSTYFTLTLPKMNAGDEYTITYTAKITDGNSTGNNKVTVTSKKDNNDNLYHEASVDTKYDTKTLEKTAAISEDGTKVTWTITVGHANMNLEGWTLSDTINGVSLPESTEVTMTDSTGNKIEDATSLPYTFKEGATGPVTVTYTTDLTYLPGANSMTNTASLDKKGSPSYTDTKNVQGGDNPYDPFKPVSKKAGSVKTGETDSSGKTLANIDWTYTIDATRFAIEPILKDADGNYYWSFQDSMSNQYFTQKQLSALKANIKDAMSIAGINENDYKVEWQYGWFNGQQIENGFTVKVYKTLPKESKIVFNFTSTGLIDNVEKSQSFYNAGSVNDKQRVDVEAKYHPVVHKENSTFQGKDTFAYTDLTDNTLKWKFNVAPPEGCTSLTITENLPEDLTPEYLKLTLKYMNRGWESSCEKTFELPISSSTTYYVYKYESHNYNVIITDAPKTAEEISKTDYIFGDPELLGKFTLEQNDGKLTITPDQTLINYLLANSYDLQFEIGLKFDSDPFNGEYTRDSENIKKETYDNTVSVSYKVKDAESEQESEEQTATDSSKQTITNEDTSSYITKDITKNSNNDGSVTYTLDINPKGEKLSDSNTINVVDTLAFYSNQTVVTNLVEIKIYSVDNGAEIEPSSIQYTMEQTVEDANGQKLYKSILKFELPNEKHIKIVYTYKFVTLTGETYLNISNTAKILEIDAYDKAQKNHSENVKVPDAEANIREINVYKVDELNYNTLLSNASFELYKWHKTENGDGHWDYVQTLTTDDGKFLFKDIVDNLAYMLVEVKAPSGYVLDQTRHYFLRRNVNSETNYPLTKPDWFTNNYYVSSDTALYIPNSRQTTTSATAVKKWQDVNGKDITSEMADASVTVKLKQTCTIYPPTLDLTTLGASANVNLTFGVNSQYTNQYTESIPASVGDKIVVTVKVNNSVIGSGVEDTHDANTNTETQTDTTSLIPGLMEVTDTANNHLICEEGTREADYRVFTYEYLVTGNATLTGWTYVSNDDALDDSQDYNLNSSNIQISVDVKKRGTFEATTTKDYEESGKQTLSSSNNWTYTWTDLPVYDLDPNTGKILAYYSYSIEETAVSGANMYDYNQEYSTDENGNLVVTNRKIDKSQIKIEKQWYDKDDKLITDTSEMPEVTVKLYQAIEGKTSNFIASGKPSTGGDSESGGDTGKTLTIKFKVGNDEKTFTETTNVSVTGSSVVLNVYSPWSNKGDPTVSVGGQTYPCTSKVNMGKYVENDSCYSTHEMTKYVFKIPLTADSTEIIIVASGGDLGKTFYQDPGASKWPDWFFTYEADSSTVSLQSVDDEIEILSDEDDTTTPDTADNYPMVVGTYTLHSDNNWTYTVENLSKTGTVDGKTVNFVYFIVETPVEGYSTWYSTDQSQWYITSNESYTSSGTLYVKNKELGDNKEVTTSITVEKQWDDDYTATEDVTVELWKVLTPVKQEQFSYTPYLVYADYNWWPQVQYYDGLTNNPADKPERIVKATITNNGDAPNVDSNGNATFVLTWNYGNEKNQYDFNNYDVEGFSQIRVVIPGAYTQFSDYAVSAVAVTLDNGSSQCMIPDELAKVSLSPQYVDSGNKDSNGKEIWVPNYNNLEINLDNAMKTFYTRIYQGDGEYDQTSTVMFNDTFQIDITLSPVEEKVDNTDMLHTADGADVYDKIQLDETGVRIDFKATAKQSSAAQGAIWMLYSTDSSDSSAYANSKYHIWEQNANGSGDEGTEKPFYGRNYSTTDSTALSSAGIGYEYVKENEIQFVSELAAGANGTIEAYLKTIGGQNYAIVKMEIAGVTSVMTLPLAQLSTDNIYLALTCDYATLTDITVQSRATSFPTPSANVTLKETQILKEGNNWTHTWTDLPLTLKDETGTVTGYYTYFVKEVKVGNAQLDESVGVNKIGKYSVEYSTYNPIPNGAITITNHDTSVTLPESGGNGTHLYTLCGLALVFGAALTWIYLKRRKGVDAN